MIALQVERRAEDLVRSRFPGRQDDPSPVRAAMGAGWERVSQGMVETEAGPLLLIDVAALVSGAEAKAA